ncbi:hypothetical protein HY29_06655 [Hyphomonas beringensis]|uniref:Magnesium transporter MgtE intracellular domain-containing protein n=1 Tax=Hyphomonas beringensis TaxID=1280946 RepID=A0A062TYC7_9PROT|nr:hypothetical protein [Hyphomonas beringensis]KCZ51027.1 hypothetical protein HY29_06655 [Hyphomonas beringensis]
MGKNGNGRTNVLLTIGILFTVAGGTRWLPQAFATTEDDKPKASLAPTALPTAYDVDSSDRVRNICFSGDMAEALEQDQKNIEQRIADLRDEEIQVQNRKLELDQQAEDLKAIQAELDQKWQKMSETANQDIQHLAQMYGAMKPDQAAGIFNQMDPGFAAGFLRLIPSDQAGLIMANMQSDKAYIVSVKLASQNKDVREALANP